MVWHGGGRRTLSLPDFLEVVKQLPGERRGNAAFEQAGVRGAVGLVNIIGIHRAEVAGAVHLVVVGVGPAADALVKNSAGDGTIWGAGERGTGREVGVVVVQDSSDKRRGISVLHLDAFGAVHNVVALVVRVSVDGVALSIARFNAPAAIALCLGRTQGK